MLKVKIRLLLKAQPNSFKRFSKYNVKIRFMSYLTLYQTFIKE